MYPHCVSTGGSRVVPLADLQALVDSGARESSGEDGAGLPLPPGEGWGEGGSQATTAPQPRSLGEYWPDTRPLPTVTLEQIIAEHKLDRIDVLKLDCEGSEFSILENTTSLDRIGAIIGEYHGRERFLELVARRFSDWQFRIIRDGDPGTFWLVNPRAYSRHHAPRDVTSSEFWQRFLAIVHPLDEPIPESWQQYYGTLFALAKELKPRRACEIGVRAGYSAFAILSANPSAWIVGIDADLDERTHNTHWGRKGLYRHAEEILAGFDYQLLIANSHALERLPRCDLVYIDADHTFDGCLADLRLAERSTDRILVDDYDSIPSVREACDRFAAEQPDFATRYIANGLTGFLLFEHRSQQTEERSEMGDER